ncbi:MAG: MerR family transcriptional regulator, partial [Candidatus Marinimicrobia bacterium]|nr:MerR family transcriptional regulator [Candidatus Neomarinimicrobiota bacterium]
PKNRAGNRTYRQKDIELIQRLKQLLHIEKFTIEGARKKLTEKPEKIEAATEEEQPVISEAVADENSTDENKRRKKMLSYIRQELESMLGVLQR